jgi:hypothetical protein
MHRRVRRLAIAPLLALLTAVLVPVGIVLDAPVANAAPNAVIPTSSSPGTSPDVVNNYQQVNFGPNDDGSWPCGGGNASVPCTGSETGPALYPIGFTINFYGTPYNSLYINNNGNLTFDAPLSQFTPSDLTTFGSPILAPFFADVDTRGANSAIVNFGTGTLNGMNVFVVNWPGVGCYDEVDSVLDNFQMILIDRPDLGTGANGDDFDIEYNYDSIQWDTGEASTGDTSCQNGDPGDSAYVGYSNGTSTDSYNLPGSGVPNTFLDSNTTTGLVYNSLNSSTLGRYIFQVSNGQPTQPTTLSTSLSGGGQSGTSITVPPGTAVTDSATVSNGTSDQNETGTVTYNVYSDSACTDEVSDGTPETITTAGTLPPSQPVTFSSPGSYYWQAVYSGDSLNNGSVSSCGSEIETVSPTSTTLSTNLTGGGQSGSDITVPPGTPVTDSAIVSGANAAGATGTVTYDVYSDPACSVLVSAGTAEAITIPGTLPGSASVTLTTVGPYYWQVSYSGDSANGPSVSSCGSEVESVTSTTSTPTCTLSGVNDGPPSQVQFTTQDTTSGLASVKTRWHTNAKVSIPHVTPGTTSPVTATFTKRQEAKGGNASILATNEAGSSVFCAGQFKTVDGGQVYAQGFVVSNLRDNLVLQNSTTGLSAASITVNGVTVHVDLTPGEQYQLSLSSMFHMGKNSVTVDGTGPASDFAVVAIWGPGLAPIG